MSESLEQVIKNHQDAKYECKKAWCHVPWLPENVSKAEHERRKGSFVTIALAS